MKATIHPNYYSSTVTCVCSNSFTTGSVKKEIHVEVCNVCHPFYTKKRSLVDTAGRVEKFRQRMAQAQK